MPMKISGGSQTALFEGRRSPIHQKMRHSCQDIEMPTSDFKKSSLNVFFFFFLGCHPQAGGYGKSI